jgi:hypothetical protein
VAAEVGAAEGAVVGPGLTGEGVDTGSAGAFVVGSGVSDGSVTASGVAVAVAKFWSEPEEPLLAIRSTSALSVMSVASSVNPNVRIVCVLFTA